MNQLLVINARDARLRLQCKCGAIVSVVPRDMKQSVFYCPNCSELWPGAVDDNHVPSAAVQKLAVALRDLQREDTGGYCVQFEAE
jgi:hypothetical protein